MQKTDISQIFSLLSPAELVEFGDYLLSPYFRVPKRLVKLYENVLKNQDQILNGNITRRELASGILKKSNDDTALRKLFSDFNRTIEEFLICSSFSKDKFEAELMLAKVYRQRAFPHKARLALENILKQLKKFPSSDQKNKITSSVYEELNLLEDSSDFHKFSPSLEAESEFLDAYYLGRKLYLFQLMYSKEKLNSAKRYNTAMLGEILGFIRENEARIKKNFPDIYLKYLMLKMLESPDAGKVIEYREYLESAEETLSQAQLIDYYSDLYNYITIRISEGDHFFRKPLLGLYKMLDPKGLLYDSGKNKIHIYTYKQVVDTAIHLNDAAWAEYFAKKYADSVDDPGRKNIVNLVYAKVNSLKGDLKAARINLAKVDYRDFIHYLDSKLFLFCMESDASNFDEAELLTGSILKYLKHNKDLPESNKINTKRFLHYAAKLLKLKTGTGGGFELQKLEAEFNSETRSLYARNWLKDKFTELNTGG